MMERSKQHPRAEIRFEVIAKIAKENGSTEKVRADSLIMRLVIVVFGRSTHNKSWFYW